MTRPIPIHERAKRSRMIRVHPIKTGSVQFRPAQIRARARGLGRWWPILSDREWTRDMPIYCYLIEHPEGLFMIDAGETARVMEQGFMPRWNPYLRHALRYKIRPEDEVGPQLMRLGFDPADVGAVVMTSLALGHAGGIDYFRRARIIVSAPEWSDAMGGLGRLADYPQKHWPKWLTPRIVTFNAGRLGGLPRSQPLTGDGALYMVRTPGHTPGHIAAVLEDGGYLYVFSGDASYLRATMAEAVPDGLASNPMQQTKTLKAIRELAQSRPLIYLPTFDPDAERRLAARDVNVD